MLKNVSKINIYLGLCVLLFLVFFGYLFGFHVNNDTDSFLYTIDLFRGQSDLIFPNRYLNPFYPVVASTLLKFLSPTLAIVVMNIVFYVGIAFLTFGLIKRVFESEMIGFIAALGVITNYAMVRYALTQVQDMGGYFWFIATLYTGWRWWEDKSWKWLIVSGICTAFGLLTKESGAMAALFVGVLVLVNASSFKQKTTQLLIFSVWPFVTLVINKVRGGDVNYDSIRWLTDNWKTYAPTNYHFVKWFGVNASTFNFTWLLFFIGLYFIVKNYSSISRDIKIYLLAVFLPSLSYFAWPVFISRTVFIFAWFIVPVAAFGLYNLYSKTNKILKSAAILGLFVMVLMPSALQYTLRYAHVFKIYEDCSKSLVCSWNYFWEHRSEISTEK
jgi:4-amino-4-deoxy-L-arabinose transferase-like glycosyltransferase